MVYDAYSNFYKSDEYKTLYPPNIKEGTEANRKFIIKEVLDTRITGNFHFITYTQDESKSIKVVGTFNNIWAILSFN